MDKPKHVNETDMGQNITYQRLTNTCRVQPERDEQNSQQSAIKNSECHNLHVTVFSRDSDLRNSSVSPFVRLSVCPSSSCLNSSISPL